MDGPQFDVHADASWKHSVLFRLSCGQTTALEESRRQLSLIWLCGVGVAE